MPGRGVLVRKIGGRKISTTAAAFREDCFRQMAGVWTTEDSGDDRDGRGPILRARLLGGVELWLGEVRVPPLDSARAESLLAYLLLRRGAAQQRQHVAFTLWPDSTESQARTNLRHVLHNLRRALPEADRFLDVGQRTLRWREERPVWLDVEAFEQAVAGGSSRGRDRGVPRRPARGQLRRLGARGARTPA